MAPSARSRASSSALPVAAQTSWPRSARIATCGRADAAARPRDEDGAVARAQAALLEGQDGHRGREAGRPDRHRIAGGQTRGQRHDPGRRHALVLGVPAMPGDAEVVAVGEDGRTHLDVGRR